MLWEWGRGSNWEGFLEVCRPGLAVAVAVAVAVGHQVCFRWCRYLPCGERSSSFSVLSTPWWSPLCSPRAQSVLPQLQRQPSPVPVLQTKDRTQTLLGSLLRKWRH